jgi:hypothetical protein
MSSIEKKDGGTRRWGDRETKEFWNTNCEMTLKIECISLMWYLGVDFSGE